MQQFLLSTKLGQFIVGSGWLALLTWLGYWVYTGRITTTVIYAIVAAICGGGGVHFIYTRNNGKNGNGNGNGAATGGAH